MATPADKTIKNLNGKWQMNKTQSKDFDPVLQLQGIGWLTRKVINNATITVTIKQYTDEQGAEHVDVDQALTGGIKSTPEPRVLDWQMRPHSDSTFGELVGRTRLVNSKELDAEHGAEDIPFLSEGWDSDEQLQSWVKNEKGGWVGNQIWGFQMIEGVRKYVRKAAVRKGTEVKTALLVYDYLGDA